MFFLLSSLSLSPFLPPFLLQTQRCINVSFHTFLGFLKQQRCIPQSLSWPWLCCWPRVSSSFWGLGWGTALILVSWWRKKSNEGWTMQWLSSFYSEVAHIISKKLSFHLSPGPKENATQFKFFFVVISYLSAFSELYCSGTAPISSGLQQQSSNSCYVLCQHANSGSKAALNLWPCSSVFFSLASRIKE